MGTVYFLGAGASAEDGLPVTNQLNYGIASFLLGERGSKGRLRRYYEKLYGIGTADLEPARDRWEQFLDDRSKRPEDCDKLPGLIETLSVLDLSIEEGVTLGARRNKDDDTELSADFLRSVRTELCMALGQTIRDALHGKRSPNTNRLVANLGDGDVVISTNWDRLVERALTYFHREETGAGVLLSSTNVRHGCVNERPVNRAGDDIGYEGDLRTVLKLHGSLSWFYCPCCEDLYANMEGQWIVDPIERRPGYEECHCGAGLENLIVPPSFVKNYRNVHIRSTWRNAQRALDSADRWVFIGYSLPPDDYHIRALLLRSGHTNRKRRPKDPLLVEVVNYKEDVDMQKRYEDLIRFAKIEFAWNGLSRWLDAAGFGG